MLRIRLARAGRKGRPIYRIVVADARSKRDGKDPVHGELVVTLSSGEHSSTST